MQIENFLTEMDNEILLEIVWRRQSKSSEWTTIETKIQLKESAISVFVESSQHSASEHSTIEQHLPFAKVRMKMIGKMNY